ncbi:MAG TPA: nucleoside-diphosphate-sugar pyrophosphorylase [Elusimicrobia bacterium]|nr:nucleoside-diphosphate-sugar pyrophosphorylase [Elusimicrobiota bacterium]HBT60134.1 nucleoside-diphosphate-sugar pyrophosphorylase [Elusimicrobiota bacterium]
MQAVILAGGKGTRLRPFTTSLPKPLVPVGDYPIIEIVLRQLKHFGFNEVIVSTGHLAELIEAYCGDGRRWRLRIRYVREDKPLSTAGALKLIRGLREDFLTINGDILTTLDFRALFAGHRRSRAAATIAVCQRQTLVDFGTIRLDAENRLQAYVEKPAYRYLVSMGVNVFDRKVLGLIRPGEAIGIPELISRLREAGEPVIGFRNGAEWLDIGRPEDYQAAQDLFSSPQGRAKYLRR